MVKKGESERLLRIRRRGFALVLAVAVVFILAILGFGLLTVAYGARLRVIMMKNEAIAKMTTEAGYEDAIWWMSGQDDLFNTLVPMEGRSQRDKGKEETVPVEPYYRSVILAEGRYDFSVSFDHFIGTLPVYRIESTGYYGRIKRKVVALIVQAVSGWDMGSCRVPSRFSAGAPINFTGSDVVDMPIHVNCYGEPDDGERDIHVSVGNEPVFAEPVSIGESRYAGASNDKYADIIALFKGGIYFNQPDSKITDRDSKEANVERFKETTLNKFSFSRMNRSEPRADTSINNPAPAVQLEFYLHGNGQGMVRITNHCTVRCFQGWDYDYKHNDVGSAVPYNIYGYHYVDPENKQATADYKIKDTYVVQQVAVPNSRSRGRGEDNRDRVDIVKSDAGGQIYVEGNVIIGGEVRYNVGKGRWEINIGDRWYDNKFKGQLMVVATGNIWIVSPQEYAGTQGLTAEGFSVPVVNNPNVLGLFSQNGVVKIIDPGLSSSGTDVAPGSYTYKTVGLLSTSATEEYERQLPDPMLVQAAITVGGGSWGAENVGQRSNTNTIELDNLIVSGSITEAVRGVVGEGQNGFKKYYYFDRRLLGGILPGDMWLQSKFLPIPGGWNDYRL